MSEESFRVPAQLSAPDDSAPGQPGPSDPPVPAFSPVPARPRHDGWSPARQVAFLETLAECGCVADAAAQVGMSPQSAYALRRRADATDFRRAWEAALDHGIRRLSDAAFSRALHGVAQPVFYKGEQIGERRHYDERLTMFLLRHHDPHRYGRWTEDGRWQGGPENIARGFAEAVDRIAARGEMADDADRARGMDGANGTDGANGADANRDTA